MPLYEYEDKQTGHRTIVSTQDDKEFMDGLVQRKLFRRVFGFSIAKSFAGVHPEDPRQEPITSKTRYKDELSRLSEEHSRRHGGMDVNYQPVDLANPTELGVSDAGVEAAKKKARDNGITAPVIQHFT